MLIQGVFLFSLVRYKPVAYLDYVYPTWGEVVGWLMALSSMLVMPFYAIYKFLITPGSFRHVSISLPLSVCLSVCLPVCLKTRFPHGIIYD